MPVLEVAANPALGTFYHAIGAFSAAMCYMPQKKLKNWSWQTYWLAQAAVCWFIAPIIGAWLTTPNFFKALDAIPREAMIWTFGLGMVYGVGGTAFGLAIKHIGFALTYAIAIGISCVLGTVAGPFYTGTLAAEMEKPGSQWIVGGIVIGVIGTAICGYAGRVKELDLQSSSGEKPYFSLKWGLPIAILAGVLSAVYGIALGTEGAPITKVATDFGAGEYNGNLRYIFANTGAFVTTTCYVLYLHTKNKTFGEYFSAGRGGGGKLAFNYLLALATGMMWYWQFWYYGRGDVRMGDFAFSGWAIHMLMLILFSNALGIAMGEWKATHARARWSIFAALVVLTVAVLSLMKASYIQQQDKIEKAKAGQTTTSAPAPNAPPAAVPTPEVAPAAQ